MSLEQKLNYQLNKYPAVKKIIKRVYQLGMYTISPKIKSANEQGEFFFGYYDKCPWDITGRYMLCMKAKDTWSDVSPKDKLEILLLDTLTNTVVTVAESNSWNVQQGCMAQWLGPEFKEKIIYNDFRNGHYCSVILNVFTGHEERIISVPIYTVATDGKTALTLISHDFIVFVLAMVTIMFRKLLQQNVSLTRLAFGESILKMVM